MMKVLYNSEIEILNKMKLAFNRMFNYILLIAALAAGFFIGRESHKLLSDEPKEQAPIVKTMKEISIAVNESNSVLIINRIDGKYEMYSDSVGFTIFRMYANRIKQNITLQKDEK